MRCGSAPSRSRPRLGLSLPSILHSNNTNERINEPFGVHLVRKKATKKRFGHMLEWRREKRVQREMTRDQRIVGIYRTQMERWVNK